MMTKDGDAFLTYDSFKDNVLPSQSNRIDMLDWAVRTWDTQSRSAIAFEDSNNVIACVEIDTEETHVISPHEKKRLATMFALADDIVLAPSNDGKELRITAGVINCLKEG